MQIILKEDVHNLGAAGEVVTVRAGYGRNFLIPQGKAVRATKDNRTQFETQRSELEQVANDRLQSARDRAAKLVGGAVSLAARASEEGRLYGSIGTREIADAITDRITEVSKAEVRMPEGAIRQVGEYDIEIGLHTDVVVTVKVTVIPE